LKERHEGREKEEEDVSSYWVTLSKIESIGIGKSNHQDRTRWQAALADGIGLSPDRLRDPGHGGHDSNFGISRKSKPCLRTHEVALSLASTYMQY